MIAVQAIYDGTAFVPKVPFALSKGAEVTITIKNISNNFSEKQKKLEAFKQLTKEISESNSTDPLPEEFDSIISQRVNFRELSDL